MSKNEHRAHKGEPTSTSTARRTSGDDSPEQTDSQKTDSRDTASRQQRTSVGTGPSTSTDGRAADNADGDTVLACPECDKPGVRQRSADTLRGQPSAGHYACRFCSATFDEPVERERERAQGDPGYLAGDLAAADPDDIGRPMTDGGGFDITLDRTHIRDDDDNLKELWKATVDNADGYDDMGGDTPGRALRALAREFDEVFGAEPRTDGGQVQRPAPDAADTLTRFQLDMLYLLAAKRDQADYGLGLKRSLEGYYDRDVNHGRLYPNLDDLVERGLVEKSELDKRTNEYALTAAGEELLAEDANRRHDVTSDLEGDR